jgi:hypothetical protein
MAPVGLAVLLLLGTAHAKFAVQEGTAQQRASAWLRDHSDGPSADAAGMADLKASDPNAFAIVQALLTKKSLGLLDPSNPSASFGGEKHHAHSFKQEAESSGLSLSEAPVSDSAAAVSDPYPSAGTGSALPFPEAANAPSDSHFGFHPHDDDAMVQSVLGAVSQLKTHGSAFATKKSTTSVNSDANTPISIDWGNPHAGVDQPAAPARQSLVVSQSQSSDQQSAMVSSAFKDDANALGQELVVQDENAHNSVASATHHAPIVPPSLDWGNTHAGMDQTYANPQMSMGQQNSYLAATPLSTPQSQDPESDMEQSSFHRLAQSFRKFSQASTRSQVTQAAPAPQDATYKKDLKAAKDEQWKFALESTSWGKSSQIGTKIAAVQEAFDDSDGVDPVEEERVRQEKVAKFLGAPKQYTHYAPAKTMMAQESEDDSDGGAKFEEWIGSNKAKDLEKSYDNVMPQNAYMKSYMADLTH